MVKHHLDCDWLLSDPGSTPAQAGQRVTLEDGRIAALSVVQRPPTASRRLVLPALANAHDHARTFRSATLGSYGKPLETWLPYLGVTPAADPYLGAVTSFARSARRGVSHLMVHYTRVQGGMPYVDEVDAVARAARDVGINIGFAVSIRDQQGIAYCADSTVLSAVRADIRDEVAQRLSAPATTPAEQLARVEEIAQMLAAGNYGSHVTLQYGPNGVQWCSRPLLEAIAQASADTGRPIHMHLLETKYQRAWMDAQYPQGVVAYLDEIGLLSPRLTLAHCVWARPDELALLAERGVTIAVNTSSNLGIRSGIAPVPEMLRQGCRVAMGMDGLALDEDDDALREMRLAFSLHRGWGYDEQMSRAQLWQFAARNGRQSVAGVQASIGARIAVGEPADLLVLDWDAVDDDALFPDIDPFELLLARAHGGHIQEVYIGGRQIVAAGKVVTVDEEGARAELIAQVRSSLQNNPAAARWREVLDVLSEDLGPFYSKGVYLGCC